MTERLTRAAKSRLLQVAAAGALALLAAGFAYAKWAVVREDQRMREDLLYQARLFVQTLNRDHLRRLAGNESDAAKPEYRRLKEQLMAAQQVDANWQWIYLMGRTTNRTVFFQMDSEAYDAPDPSPPGQPYEEASDVLQGVFDHPESVTEGPVPDRWGVWVSAYVPVRDLRTGELLSVLGIDVEASRWLGLRSRAAIVPGISCLALIALWLFGCHLAGRHPNRNGAFRFGPYTEAALISAIGAVLTAALSWGVWQAEARDRVRTFRRLAEIESSPIFDTIADLRNLEINAFASFFESSVLVDAREFDFYASQLSAVPGVAFWGWIDAVAGTNRAEFEAAAAQRTGRPEFRIWEPGADGAPTAAGERPRYYPLTYLSPMDPYGAAQGYDLGTDPQRRAELDAIWQTCLPTVLSEDPLLQDRRAGRKIFVVRRTTCAGETRRQTGMLIAGLDVAQWLNAGPDQAPNETVAAVFDLWQLRFGQAPVWLGSTAAPGREEPLQDLAARPPLAVARPLLIFGNTYVLVARPTADFTRLNAASAVWLLAPLGLLLTGFVAWIFGFFAKRREHLARLVEEQNRELAESMHHYSLLARQSRVITWEIDVDGLYVAISDMAEPILGYCPDEIVGKLHFYDLCPAETREEFKREGLKLLRAGQPVVDALNASVAKSGQLVWLSSSGIPLRDENGDLKGFWGTDTDVTERKRVEKAMARLAQENQVAANRYAALIRASNSGAWEYDAATQRMWCSPEYFTQLGYEPREFEFPAERKTLQALWLDLIHPGDRDAARAHLLSYLENPRRGLYDQRYRMRRKDGGWAWIWSRGQTLTDAAGRPTSMTVGTHVDVTESMRTDEALRENEQKYRMLAEGMKDVVWFMDADTLRFLYVSPSIEKLLGFTPAEISDEPFTTAIAAAQRDGLRERLRARAAEVRAGRLAADEFFTVETPLVRRDGTLVESETICRFWQNQRTGRLEIHGTTRDVTDRRRAEEALRESERKYRTLAEGMKDVVWIVDADTLRYLYVSPSVEKLRGYTPEEVMAGTIADALLPGEIEKLRPVLAQRTREFQEGRLAADAFFTFELRQPCKNGGAVVTEAVARFWRHPQTGRIELHGSTRDVTDRKHAEENYRALFDNMVEGFALHEIVCDEQGRPSDYRFLAVNPAFERMVGRKAADIVGKTSREVLPETEPVCVETYGNVALTGNPAFFDNFSPAVGRHFEVTVFRAAPGQFACIFNDVTESRLTENELRESRRQYMALMANLPGMAYRCRNDRDWTMEFVSQGCQDLTGYAPEDLVRNKTVAYADLILPDQREFVWTEWQETLRQRGRFEQEYEIRTRAGETKWVWEQGEGVYDEQGQVLALEGFISDVTARKRAEAEHERLIRAIEQSGESILITDAQGAILYVNPAFTRATGYAREEVLGQNPRLFQSGQHDAEFYRNLWRTLEAGLTWEGQLVNKRKDGSLYTELAAISPVRDAAGRIVNFVAVKRDVTQELRVEEEKAALQSQLAHAQKLESVGRLAGGVAHDFNNTLQAILGYVEMAIEQVPPDQPLHSDLREIQKAAQRSTSLTKQLQAFARKQVAAPVVLDLNEAVENTFSMLRRLIGEEIQLVWKPGRNVGAVKIDPGQLDQLVANLCINARDAIGQSGHITLETSLAKHPPLPIAGEAAGGETGTYALLSVRDDGCGMKPDVIEHIFEPFFTTKPIGKGTGLGLSTVYGIVKQNGGSIHVTSAPGKGSAFDVYLPRHARAEMDPKPAAAETDGPAAGRHETILLVEDEETILRTTRRILESLGYHVLATDSPQDALRIADERHGHVDLLLTDVIMSGMNGSELVRHLQQRHPKIRHLFMSGYTANLLAEQGVEANNADFIQKPFSRKTLALKVKEALARA